MNRNFRFTLCAIIIFALVLLVYGTTINSPVQSEDAHLASGVGHWLYERFDLYRVNPPLVRLVAVAPILGNFSKEDKCWYRYDTSSHARSEFVVGIDVARNRVDYAKLMFRSRLIICIIFGLIGCYFTCKFAKQLFGSSSAIVALLLWCFNPYILGHGVTIMPDVPSGAMAILALWFFWRWLKVPDSGNAFMAGIMLGLAELTKFTLIIFYPLYLFIWILYQFTKLRNSEVGFLKKQVLQLAILFAISLIVINMGYIFEGTGKQLRSFRFQTSLLSGAETLKEVPTGGGNRFAGSGNFIETAIGYLPMPLPQNFIQGIDTQRFDFERGLPSYLRGEWSDHGWWYYYLYALLIKTPLGVLLLFGLAIVCTIALPKINANWRDEMVVLLPGIVLLVFVSSQTGFSVHSRYVIPALPFFFVWMSKLGKFFAAETKTAYPKITPIIRVIIVLLFAWSIASTMSVYPHCISYFNELSAVIPTKHDSENPIPQLKSENSESLFSKAKQIITAGPRNGPRHLLDSNIDWGQDLFYLEKWCQKHPEIKEIAVAYWGSYLIEKTTIPTTGQPPTGEPKPGYYAISVNYLYDQTRQYHRFLQHQPIALVGYTIYIYHVTPEMVLQPQP